MYTYGLRYVAFMVPLVEIGTVGLLTVGLLTVPVMLCRPQRLQRLAAGLLLGGTTLDGSPMPPGAWAGRPRRPVCGRKRVRCSASPSTRFTLWGLAKTRPGPHNLLPVRIFFRSCYAWGAAPGGGAAAAGCRGCGGRNSHTSGQGAGTMSSRLIPTY